MHNDITHHHTDVYAVLRLKRMYVGAPQTYVYITYCKYNINFNEPDPLFRQTDRLLTSTFTSSNPLTAGRTDRLHNFIQRIMRCVPTSSQQGSCI